jgi:hypothetical protein
MNETYAEYLYFDISATKIEIRAFLQTNLAQNRQDSSQCTKQDTRNPLIRASTPLFGGLGRVGALFSLTHSSISAPLVPVSTSYPAEGHRTTDRHLCSSIATHSTRPSPRWCSSRLGRVGSRVATPARATLGKPDLKPHLKRVGV